MAIKVSAKVADKIYTKHGLTMDEVKEAISGRLGNFLEDMREEHKTDPPTQWFLGYTDFGKLVKVVFIYKDGNIVIRTAYQANSHEIAIYNKHAL